MPTTDERLASLEARMDAMSDLRGLITELRADINGRFGHVDGRFGDVEGRLTELRADMNSRFDDVNRRLLALDHKFDRHFTWLASTPVAMLLAVVGALLDAYYR